MSKSSWPVAGKVVLITGAARGIGAESARRLVARGAKLSLVGLEPQELERVAAQCGRDAAWFEADVTDVDALDRAVSGTLERFGAIDVVVANAGVGTAGPLRLLDRRAFERTVEINLLGSWRTVHACLPHVIERRGYVLAIASVAALLHAAAMGAYAASKAGVEAYADALRLELAHHGVGVGVGYFYWIGTDMLAGGDAHPEFARFRQRLPGPLGRTYPVSAAGESVARGIEDRARWVVTPGWVRALIYGRGVLQLLAERKARRLMPELDRLSEQYLRDRGEDALLPYGVGGAAAVRSERGSANDEPEVPSG
jgi:NAD(P)-dependent dehydrogenase (short-subunit alcohol dehydrogenase family)